MLLIEAKKKSISSSIPRLLSKPNQSENHARVEQPDLIDFTGDIKQIDTQQTQNLKSDEFFGEWNKSDDVKPDICNVLLVLIINLSDRELEQR